MFTIAINYLLINTWLQLWVQHWFDDGRHQMHQPKLHCQGQWDRPKHRKLTNFAFLYKNVLIKKFNPKWQKLLISWIDWNCTYDVANLLVVRILEHHLYHPTNNWRRVALKGNQLGSRGTILQLENNYRIVGFHFVVVTV